MEKKNKENKKSKVYKSVSEFNNDFFQHTKPSDVIIKERETEKESFGTNLALDIINEIKRKLS